MNDSATGWIKGLLKEMVPELLAEFIGVQSIKKLLRKGKEKADEAAKTEVVKPEGAASAERSETKDVKSGMFTLKDEERYFELMSDLSKEEAVHVSFFVANFLEPWQQRRFRVAVGNLDIIVGPPTSEWVSVKKTETAKKYSLRKGDTAPGEDKRTEYEQKEQKSVGKTINLGVKFLKSFAKCNELEMLDICEAAGIMHSDFDGVKQAWKKITTWAEQQGPALVNNMEELTRKLNANTKPREPKKPYRGFWRELFGIGQ